MPPTKPPFWDRVNKNAFGCWEWTGPVDAAGYGRHGQGERAHRIAYRELVGEIPEGMDLDHLCAVRDCVNPEHLEPVTRGENVRRGRGAWKAHYQKQTHCKWGHSLEDAYQTAGGRLCRQCSKRKSAEGHRRRKERV